MGKVESNKKQKKDALFNTAFELFTTKGTNKTTISDIADKAGVAKGTFYLYFKDKYDIRNKLVSYKTKELFYRAYQSSRIMPFLFLFPRIFHGAFFRQLSMIRCRTVISSFISSILN